MGGEVECVEAGCALSAPGEGVASKLARSKKRIRQNGLRGWVKCSVFLFFHFRVLYINTDDETFASSSSLLILFLFSLSVSLVAFRYPPPSPSLPLIHKHKDPQNSGNSPNLPHSSCPPLALAPKAKAHHDSPTDSNAQMHQSRTPPST